MREARARCHAISWIETRECKVCTRGAGIFAVMACGACARLCLLPLPGLQGAQGQSSRLRQGTCYSTAIMVPSLGVIVGYQSHAGMDTTKSARVWKDVSREETETKQRNRHNFSVDTGRSGVLSCRLLTTIGGKSSLGARHARGRRRPLGLEGLATLALRQLNRQPAGVLARNYTTFRLHPCVRSPSLYANRDRRRSHSVCKSGQHQVSAPVRQGQRGSCGRQPSLAPLTQRMRVAGSEAK